MPWADGAGKNGNLKLQDEDWLQVMRRRGGLTNFLIQRRPQYASLNFSQRLFWLYF